MLAPRIYLVLATALFGACAARADVTPAAIFQNHAVLQAGRPVPVWGTADPGEKVAVTFAGQTVSAVADATGAWRAVLAPLKVNATSATLTLKGKNTVTLTDILVGEVWLCAGQSNMEFTLNKAKDGPAEIAAANDPLIRQFAVNYKLANEPQTKLGGYWSVCSPSTGQNFSAVGYFFARELRQKLGVPVAIINSTWGGTDIEAWMPPDVLARQPELNFVAAAWQKRMDNLPATTAAFEAAEAEQARLAAEAKARGETYVKPWRRAPPKADGSPHEDKPSAIYNAKIHPLAPFALAGILWYQGEGGHGPDYRRLFPALITGWRARFAQGDLPFYWVQLPNYEKGKDWPAMREALASALTLPRTGQAVTIDVGENKDIHPKNKQDVGHRLAFIALKNTYGQKITASGPVFKNATFSGGSARVTFTETAAGLVAKTNPLAGFELAGADKKFVPAEARLEGATVIVKSSSVSSPVAVRYAWKNAPEASLFNTADLHAAPFRSDTW
jgi:sialate O-acetylesterase